MVRSAPSAVARRRLCTLAGLGCAWSAWLWSGAVRAALNASEMARVERLLAMIASRHDVRLVRNGKDYDADMAVRFLRGKLDAMGGELKNAEDFIERIATRSSTTGQLYRVRLPDGREIGAGEFLRLELVRQDKAAGGR